MAKLQIPFVEKEGKFFAPIISTEPRYGIVEGAVAVTGEKVIGGVKGVRARVRMSLPPNMQTESTELFVLNTEFFQSSQ